MASTPKKSVKKVSKVGSKAAVFKGGKEKTKSGLTKEKLMKNKSGRIVSKKKSMLGKKNQHIKKWASAVQKARKSLGIRGFAPVGGKTKQGQELHKKAKELHNA